MGADLGGRAKLRNGGGRWAGFRAPGGVMCTEKTTNALPTSDCHTTPRVRRTHLCARYCLIRLGGGIPQVAKCTLATDRRRTVGR
jgi:hypothetical protein